MKIIKITSKILNLAISLLSSVFVVYFILKVNKIDFFSEIKGIRIGDLVVTFLIFSITYIIDSFRYKVVLKPFQVKIKFIDLINNNILGYVFSSITPFGSGGQPLQIIDLSKNGLASEKAFNIVLSRVVEMMILNLLISIFSYRLVVVSLQNSMFGRHLINLGLLISVVVVLIIILLVVRVDVVLKFVFLLEHKNIKIISKVGKKMRHWLHKASKSIKFLWSEKFVYVLADMVLGLLNLCFQALALYYMLIKYAAYGSVSVHLLYLKVLGGMALLNMVVYYLPTPGASGGIEGAYQILFFSMIGNNTGVLIAIIGWRFACYYMQIIIGFIFTGLYNIGIKK